MTDKRSTTDVADSAASGTEADQPLTLLGRDEIIGLQDRRYRIVNVRAWDGRPVRIRSLSAKEREEYEQSITQQIGDGQSRTNIVGARAKLCVRIIVDKNGNLIFDDSFVGALGEKNADAIGQIFEEGSKFSGIMKRDVEELVGNSAGTRTGNSSSPSP